MGDEKEGRRRSLMGAGPLLGQLHSLPSEEAEGGEGCAEKVAVDMCMQMNIQHPLYSLINICMLWTTHHAWVLRL